MTTSIDLCLSGCNPSPLSGYLRALAVLRLVSEQMDSEAQGYWVNNEFHLKSTLTRQDLVSFLTEKYRPTPVCAPWNGGSGFYPKDTQEALQEILSSTAGRLQAYRETILKTLEFVSRLHLTEQPKERKDELLELCRSWWPDEAVEWLDAAVVLTSNSPKYPPLLGTGGNDGRLEFTNNFMQHVVRLMDTNTGEPTLHSQEWLNGALFGESTGHLLKSAPGQFHPGGGGGPNAKAGFEGSFFANPWEYVLALEGALTFSAAAVKRLETGRTAVLSYPFTVYPSSVGSGSIADISESKQRAEMWMPLWSQPATFRELGYLFQEGRVHVGNRPARDGVDFARACATLAVDRGIDSFQRFSFAQRSGNMYLAVPLNRLQVKVQPEAELLNDLDQSRWLDQLSDFSRGTDIGSFKSAYRALREAIFRLCVSGGPRRVQDVLVMIGRIERLLAHSPAARDIIRPLTLRNPQWTVKAADRSYEWELAISVASWYTEGLPQLRAYFSPVDPSSARGWDKFAGPRLIWKSGDVSRNLLRLMERRMMDAESKLKDRESPDGTWAGEDDKERGRDGRFSRKLSDYVAKPFWGAQTASLPAVQAFLEGKVNEERLADFLWGALPLSAGGVLRRRDDSAQRVSLQSHSRDGSTVLPYVYAVTRLTSVPNGMLNALAERSEDVPVQFPKQILFLLATDRSAGVERAAQLATRRLVISGLVPKHGQVQSPFVSGRRCGAALVFPLAMHDLGSLYRRLMERQNTTEER
ncbi:type I-U CRISPR-associated protein Csx17 [Alicyclobacillus sp. SP_1]|uniref:type I-G CRISPR-associated protein Cas8g1/Csx17 n=1 Tax=Alicyclobacillus sp. SP_1 TaxID=2942475 RepID=UPI0021574ACE|nr:type I-U CRISPR-associated protein Csx17 [Alicyclobacillus sp. SP_1]